VTADNYWIKVDSFNSAYKNNITASGTTNLPEGSPLEVSVTTTIHRTLPQGYDTSHEDISVDSSVIWINRTSRGFSTEINVSELNLGKYILSANSEWNYSIYSNGVLFDLLPAQSLVTPVQMQCPPLSSNFSPYIVIYPVGHFTFGDSIEITGTTNIGYSKKIQYFVIPAAVPVPTGVPASTYYPLLPQGDVRITGGDCTRQTWSFMLDSTNLTWTGGLYVGADNLTFPNGTSQNKVRNITGIRVHQANGGPTWGEIG
jgi:hypothetical protein